MIRLFVISFFYFLLCVLKINAQDSDFSLIFKIDTPSESFTTDIFGNIYIINGNIITKYNKNGQKISSWSSNNKGRITFADASDPMKILVYSGEFGVITLLDNTLTPVAGPVFLSELGYLPPLKVCSASEGGFWIFDNSEAQLHRYSNSLKSVVKSPEIRFNDLSIPEPSFLLEHNNNIYISDTAKGLIITDKYGTIIRTLPLKNIYDFHCLNNNLIYQEDNNVIFLNINTFKKNILSIPFSDFSGIRTDNDRLYLINNKGLRVFKMNYKE